MYYPFLLVLCIIKVKAEERGRQVLAQMRIIGGEPCDLNQYPFIVSIHLRDPIESIGLRNYSHYCAGTLLNSGWVLSAAHCYIKDRISNLEDYLAVAGIGKLSQFNNKDAQKSKLEKIITKTYDAERHKNDIALLKLKTPLKTTKTVNFVTLAGNTIVPDISTLYKQCTTAGWGLLIPIDVMGLSTQLGKEDYPDQLMCINLPLIKFKQCQNIFLEKVPDVILSNSQMCTLYPKGGKDACVGDSGGPLVCGKIQHGITSWGLGCAQKGYPGVFTRTDKYINWIKSVTGKVQTKKVGVENKKSRSVTSLTQAPNLLISCKFYIIFSFLLALFGNIKFINIIL